MKDDWVPINFPADIIATVSEWLEAADGSVGLCLVCGESFGETDMIPGRPGYHNCPANVMSVFAKLSESYKRLCRWKSLRAVIRGL
jgi:hypothetical protein